MRGRALVLVGVASASLVGASVAVAARMPTRTEFAAMRKAAPEQQCALRNNALISTIDGRYAVMVTQLVCGATSFQHYWLRHYRTGWKVADLRSGTIDSPSGCTQKRAVPGDIRQALCTP